MHPVRDLNRVKSTGGSQVINGLFLQIQNLRHQSLAQRCHFAPTKWAVLVNSLKPRRHHLATTNFRDRDFETSLQGVLPFIRRWYNARAAYSAPQLFKIVNASRDCIVGG